MSADPTLARYTLGEEIARGGVGVVVAARDTRLGRDVAVKLLRPEYRTQPTAVRRFLAEAHITGQLQHPGIPPVHDLGTLSDGSPFLVMKLIRGRTLREMLPAEPAVRWRLVGVVEQVAQTLAYAHAQGVIHRDIKPGNVMVGAFGEAQLMDWGLAKELARESPERADPSRDPPLVTSSSPTADARTEAGSILGTPAYMPPEQAAGRLDRLDRRTDVFSLGAVLCELLTGKPPYVGETTTDVKVQSVVGYLRPAYDRLDACGADPELTALARWCLTADPAGRPADAGVVAEALAAHRTGVEAKLRAAEVGAAEQRVRRRLRTLLAAAVMLALAAGGAAAGWQWRRAVAALGRETAERERVADALRRERQTRDRMLDSARRQSLQLARLALVSETDVDKEEADKVVDDFRRLWADLLADAGTGPEADRLRADHELYQGTFHQSRNDYPTALGHFRRAVDYWRGVPADRRDGPAGLRTFADALLRLAMTLPTDWVGLDPLPFDGPANGTGTGLAGLAGPAAVAANFHTRAAVNQQEINGLLRECVAARRHVVAATSERPDRVALADALAVAADMTGDEVSRRQWDADELAELLTLTGADGGVTDWCALIDCRSRLAKHAADRGEAGEAVAQIDAAEAAYKHAVQTFGKVGTHRVGLRLSLATAEVMLKVGDHKRAAAAAATYTRLEPGFGWTWLKAADWLAGCVRLAGDDRKLADEYTRRAVESLGKAIELSPDLAPRMFDSVEYLPIRDTPAFRQLKERFPAKPAAPPGPP